MVCKIGLKCINLIFHKLLCGSDNNLSCAVYSEIGGVNGHVVVIVLAPLVSGVEIIIRRTALIGLVDNIDYLR